MRCSWIRRPRWKGWKRYPPTEKRQLKMRKIIKSREALRLFCFLHIYILGFYFRGLRLFRVCTYLQSGIAINAAAAFQPSAVSSSIIRIKPAAKARKAWGSSCASPHRGRSSPDAAPIIAPPAKASIKGSMRAEADTAKAPAIPAIGSARPES